MKLTEILFLSVLVINGIKQTSAKKGFGDSEQEWGYVTVRPGAHMFWWLYYATPGSQSSNFTALDKPLIIWIQGGPGTSATGVGNFKELGLVDIEGNPRNYSWVNDYNLLFIDNPVGTGFSYVEDDSLFARNNSQIAIDLLECIIGFLTEVPEFQHIPAYIVSQSYGGKMVAEFALNWFRAQKDGNMKSKFKGIAFGNSWISPMDSLDSWAPLLFHVGAIDAEGRRAVEAEVKKVQEAADREDWENASILWSLVDFLVYNLTAGVDFHNILDKVSVEKSPVQLKLDDFMNNEIKTALNVNVTWGKQSDGVYSTVDDFMKNVTDIVKKLKDETDLEIFVYNGQLDLLVPTAGTLKWIERIFEGTDNWRNAARTPVVVDNVVEGFKKEYQNFKMYWILRAGHYAPKENPHTVKEMLRHLTQTGPKVAT